MNGRKHSTRFACCASILLVVLRLSSLRCPFAVALFRRRRPLHLRHAFLGVSVGNIACLTHQLSRNLRQQIVSKLFLS